MEYNFREIENKWQQHWKESNAYRVRNDSVKPKCYVLDMFPYPSGAGLHVGHPLGYIASDIYSRYKRLKGFNVLHPMGFDSFGLPAEQYAIETGQHPADTTGKNIATFKKQLDKIGFCYDWEREVRTSDPAYYKWTQWLFLQLFNAYYDEAENKAKPISSLVKKFETEGNEKEFTAANWNAYTKKEQEDILMQRRLAFSSYGEVNWCEALGTVLANDEVVNGVSERGGHPVVKKKMRQWYLRITAYADRLLQGLETVNFSEAMKEMQRNWIGKSEGAEMVFGLNPGPSPQVEKGDGKIGKETGKEMDGNVEMRNSSVPKYSVSSPVQYEFARQNRKGHTEAENILWQALRNNNLGEKFRRQHPIDVYIADFVCLSHALVIEADGGYHNDSLQQEYDAQRTSILKEIGFSEIRFTNEEIISDIESVIKKIKEKLSSIKTDAENSGLQKELKSHAGKAAIVSNEAGHPSPKMGEGTGVRVYTTRPDTIFGVDFLVLAPEHEFIQEITTAGQKDSIETYLNYVKSRSDRERMAEVKQITGCFTGAYAINPFNGKEIPIWIAEYVLAGYGTGAIMAVPCGDQRDFAFAKHFNIPITNIIGSHYNGEEANATKEAVLQNSGFLNGMLMKDAIAVAMNKIEEMGIGRRKKNYRMRDAGFSRQRYWGEPFPVKWIDGMAIALDESELPLELPHVEKYGPGPEGEGPLANINTWTDQQYETSTMPGYAGSSWYFLRYMDPHNDATFCERKASNYWNQVDVYIGGTEHAVGHLLYSRMWTKVMYDLGLIGFDEPFKKLVNQGMIQGSSRFVYRLNYKDIDYGNLLDILIFCLARCEEPLQEGISRPENQNDVCLFFRFPNGREVRIYPDEFITIYINEGEEGIIILLKNIINSNKNYISSRYPFIYFSANSLDKKVNRLKFYPYYFDKIPIDVNVVNGVELNIEELKKWRNGEYADAEFILDEGKYICAVETEKMSKSKYNTVNPDDLVLKYGADTFRMYEMFLGPVEMSKPWDTKGIEGVHRFLRKLWRLFYDDVKGKVWTNEKATNADLKILHKTIKKIDSDTEQFSYNTAVSAFMIAVNELADIKCYKKEILEQVLILLTPYAPHIAEELWLSLGNAGSVLDATYPLFDATFLQEATKEYPVSINGKMRTMISMVSDIEEAAAKEIVLSNDVVQKWLEGKAPKNIIFVKGKMVNVVV